MEGTIDENITPLRRTLRVRTKKSPSPEATPSTPGSRSSQRRGRGKEATAQFWSKAVCKITPAESKELVSPGQGTQKATPRMISHRATPGKNAIAKYVITPHTVQEQDVGLTLASLKVIPVAQQSPLLSSPTSNKLTFPETVHKMIVETNEIDPDVIYWILDGEAFVVREKDKKLGQILKKHFRHGKYSSLQRQLNMYGWKKYMNGRFTGAFYNPEFHRDITRGKLIRILRRGPPPPSGKKKSTKSTLAARNVPNSNETRSDDEWQPENAAASVRSTLKERPTRTSKKMMKPTWGDSDDDNMENHSTATNHTLQRSSFPSCRKRVRDDVKCLTIPRHCGTKVRVKSLSSKSLTPVRRFGDTPRKLGGSLLSCGTDDSPTANWSPLIGGLIRQESLVHKPEQLVAHASSAYNSLGLKSTLRHPGETCWTLWRQSSQPVVPDTNWEARSDRDPCSERSAIDPTLRQTANVCTAYLEHEHRAILGRSIQDTTGREIHGQLSLSGGGVCPVNYAPSLSRSLVSAPPLLARENSAPLPIALAQRVSSSFFLPFIGMVDSLSYALELHNDSSPSTPSRAT